MSNALFKQVNYDLGSLVEFIRLGQIGLPDIQRPFVWPNAKVRDLFDSMYRGYPVGYLLFWQNALAGDHRAIGTDGKQKVPDLLIVDGQQRMTSLFAVMKGIPVIRDDFAAERIAIAFNPLHETFAVADAAIRRDKSYLPNISALWSEAPGLFKLVGDFLDQLATDREVSNEERRRIENSITRVYNLKNYPLTALELSKDTNEEQVAEVFVRINSKGKPLNQADFILTLMSVFWDEGRKELESFCRDARVPSTGKASPYNHYIEPDPDQLVRIAVAVGFKRARLQYVYSILRGKDLETGEFSEQRRIEQFDVLKEAQTRALNLQYWHDFFKAIASSGCAGGRLISSVNALIYSYAFYLLGRTEYKVDETTLRRVIARWFFMSSLTGRYTTSPESKLEFDLARFREVKDGPAFVAVLNAVCEGELTNDFWEITLPNDLATSSPRSPSLFAYYSALVLFQAKPLFSDQKLESMLDPSVHARRSAVERHHLFPKAYLKKLGISDLRETNQIANYALLEWGDNSTVSAKAPVEYLEDLRSRVSPRELANMYEWHALPDGWEQMEYQKFLVERRERIARLIRRAYTMLVDGKASTGTPTKVDLASVIRSGEGVTAEFKSALRMNLHTNQPDVRIEHSCLKTIAGFLNSNGGTLLVGVSDDGEPTGIPAIDQFPNEDKMSLHLVNLLQSRIGSHFMMYIHPRFEDYNGERVMAIECWPAKSPVYLKDGKDERFYVRAGPSTAELPASQVQEYVKLRFKT